MARLAFVLLLRLCDGHDHPPPAVSYVRHHAITTRLEPGVSLSSSHSWIKGDSPVYVSASWKGLPSALADSWVGLYLASEDPSTLVPLKYNFCNRSRTHSLQGSSSSSGSIAFRILNYRADVVFHLFHGWENPVLIAQSGTIAIHNPAHPTGVRLSLTGVQGEIAVTWTSTPAYGKSAHVQYDVLDAQGHTTQQNVVNVSAVSTYEREELCGAPANAEGFRSPGAFYTAKITDLGPGSVVTYRVVAGASSSQTFSFRAPPATLGSVKIFAFGDMGNHPRDESAQGQGEPWYDQQYAYGDPGVCNTTAAMLADHRQVPADLILHNGDLSYAMGFSSMWEVFHDNIESLSAQVPWMVSMGNHERDWPGTNSTRFGDTDSMGECGVPTMRRFASQPFISARPPPDDKPWYKIVVGVVAIVVVSTEHEIMPGSSQHSWLAAALGAVDRRVTPWVVLAGHRPYVVDSAWSGDAAFSLYFQEAVSKLVEKHEVNLILGAHHHSYQRSCRVRGGRCAERGPTIINVGTGGAEFTKINTTLPPIFRYADDKHFGYCRIAADSASLTVEFVHSDDHKVHDSVSLEDVLYT